jgi:hypothetical protein
LALPLHYTAQFTPGDIEAAESKQETPNKKGDTCPDMEVTMPPASNHPGSDNSIPSSEPPPTIHTHHPPSCSRVSSTQDQSYQFPSVPALSDKLNCMQEHGIGWALLSLLPYNDRPWIGRRGLFNVDHGDFL